MRKKARSKIQRFFIEWLEVSKSRWPASIQHWKRTDTYILFRLAGLHDCLQFLLSKNSFSLVVDMQGEIVDLLIDFDIEPRHDCHGYYCAMCEDGLRMGYISHLLHYQTRKKLYIEHQFEPMLSWINKEFSQNQWVGIELTPNFTRAWLSSQKPDNATFAFQLWHF